MDLEFVKRAGIAAAYKGGNILRSLYGKINKIDKKGAIDLVTEADTESEKAIIETIKKLFPDHTILAEESGWNIGEADHQWFIEYGNSKRLLSKKFGRRSQSICSGLSR